MFTVLHSVVVTESVEIIEENPLYQNNVITNDCPVV